MATGMASVAPYVQIDTEVLDAPSLGNRGYLLTNGVVAVAVDPPRDIDRALQWLARRGVSLTAVVETHLHEDHISGGLDLARRTGASYVVPGNQCLGYAATRVTGGEVLDLAGIHLGVLATPGHATEHVVYRVLDAGGTATAVLSGGALPAGGVPRQDPAGACWSELTAREQHRSIRQLHAGTPASALVLPGHGFPRHGRHRGDPATPQPLGEQGRFTRALHLDEDSYVAAAGRAAAEGQVTGESLAGINAAGPAPMELRSRSRPPLHAGAVRRRARNGEWVLDVRSRAAFAAQHLKGSVNVAAAGALASCVRWLVPANRRLTLVGDDAEQLTSAYRDVGGVGLDRVDVAFLDPHEFRAGDLGQVRRVDVAAAVATRHGGALLDVRLPAEWSDSHLPGALSVPLAELALRPPLPAGELWVYSSTGFRAAVAVSLLAAWGREAVLVDGEVPLPP